MQLKVDSKYKNVFKIIFEENWERFKELNPTYDRDQYNEVVEKMIKCGSELGGYAEYRCFNCGEGFKRIAFSCKSMFCLSCTKVYTDNFVSKISEMLHPKMRYRHVVLTVPEQLKQFFYIERFKGKLLKELIKEGYRCVEDIMSCKFKKKLKIGIIVVLQTSGRSGRYNPHLHVIMTNGGMDEASNEWKELGYMPYELMRKKWQYYLLKMMEREIKTPEIKKLVGKLYREYPKGFVANINKGEAPRNKSGLAKYLAKYIASPPISVRRIIEYNGKEVEYWYNDHETKKKKVERIDVITFIGRMIQHILPKGFQRVRYYGIQSIRTLKNWREKIKKYVKKLKSTINDVYEVVEKMNYRERYKNGCGKDPFICEHCGEKMELSVIWHPKYGVIFDEYERIKRGYYERRNRGPTIRQTNKILQLSMF